MLVITYRSSVGHFLFNLYGNVTASRLGSLAGCHVPRVFRHRVRTVVYFFLDEKDSKICVDGLVRDVLRFVHEVHEGLSIWIFVRRLCWMILSVPIAQF